MCLKIPSAAAACAWCFFGFYPRQIPSILPLTDAEKEGKGQRQTDSGDIKREQLNRMANSEGVKGGRMMGNPFQ